MTSSPLLPPTVANSTLLPNPSKEHVNGVQYNRSSTAEGDDRSSSLSEIGDRVGNDELGSTRLGIADASEANDTEAETERLEDSPQKTFKRKNLVMPSPFPVFTNGTSSVTIDGSAVNDANTALSGPRIDQLSEISSLADSGEDNEKIVTPSSVTSRKRKRSSSEDDNVWEAENRPVTESIVKSQHEGEPPGQPITAAKDNFEIASVEVDRKPRSESKSFAVENREAPGVQQSVPGKQKSKKGKRKSKKIRDDTSATLNPQGPDVETPLDHAVTAEPEYSNGEEVEMEDAGDEGEVELSARNEEGIFKKKSAMDSLSAIEKCFASLRDKLFDEKLAQYNGEILMLNQTDPTHPEFIARMKVIDRRHDDKVNYERTLLKFKLQALQTKSTAEKAQIHAQYMQTVREIRESNLENLHKESFQLQRERRNAEVDIPDYAFSFPNRRSQQITNQTSYNNEVSLLSGIAKYVGFPAAPELSTLKPSEVEEDLQNMGIISHPALAIQAHPMPVRNTHPPVGFIRQKPAAEEQFLEQNPWANPQHPAHHQNHRTPRQTSGLSRASTPLSNPAPLRRIVDLAGPKASAFTNTESHSRPGFSGASTPGIGEKISRKTEDGQNTASDYMATFTPSKDLGNSTHRMPSAQNTRDTVPTQKAKVPALNAIARSRPSSASIIRPQRTLNNSDAPARSMASADASATTRTASVPPTTVKYSIIKAEESLHPPRPSPSLQYHPPAVPASGLSNG